MMSFKIKILAAAIVVAGALAAITIVNAVRTPAAAAHDAAIGTPSPWSHGDVACGASLSAADCERLEMMLPISAGQSRPLPLATPRA